MEKWRGQGEVWDYKVNNKELNYYQDPRNWGRFMEFLDNHCII